MVITSQGLAEILHNLSNDEESLPYDFSNILTWLKKNNLTLQPTFPGIEEASMLVYFQLGADDEITDKQLEQLRQMPGIEAAYRKGAEELPS